MKTLFVTNKQLNFILLSTIPYCEAANARGIAALWIINKCLCHVVTNANPALRTDEDSIVIFNCKDTEVGAGKQKLLKPCQKLVN